VDSGEDWRTRRKGISKQIKYRKLAKYWHWKRRSDVVVLATTKSETERKHLTGRRTTAWINDVRRWTRCDNVARSNAVERYDCSWWWDAYDMPEEESTEPEHDYTTPTFNVCSAVVPLTISQ